MRRCSVSVLLARSPLICTPSAPTLARTSGFKKPRHASEGVMRKPIRQANADVPCRGVNVAALEERAAHATNLLPQFNFVHKSRHKAKALLKKSGDPKLPDFKAMWSPPSAQRKKRRSTRARRDRSAGRSAFAGYPEPARKCPLFLRRPPPGFLRRVGRTRAPAPTWPARQLHPTGRRPVVRGPRNLGRLRS